MCQRATDLMARAIEIISDYRLQPIDDLVRRVVIALDEDASELRAMETCATECTKMQWFRG